MKTLYVLLSCMFVFTVSAQDHPKGNIAVKAVPYSNNRELTNLMRGLNVHYNTVTFKSEDLKGKIFTLVSKEFKKGKLVRIDTLVRKSLFDFLPPIATDSITFSIMAHNTEKDRMHITFAFDRFEINHDYKVLKTDDYSLRAYCERLPINMNERFYAFAYILPYERWYQFVF